MPSIPSIQCVECKRVHPRGVSICPACGGENIQDYDAAPEGEVYTFTVNTFVPAGKFKSRAPYVIAVIKTDENMFMTALVDTPEPTAIKIGNRVKFLKYEDRFTPVFSLVS